MSIRLVEFTNSLYLGGGEVQFLELVRGLPRDYQLKVVALRAEGPLLEPLRKLGHEPVTFPLARSAMRVQTLRQVHNLARFFQSQRVQLVHVHDFYPTLLAVPAAKLSGAKVVVGRLDLGHGLGRLHRRVLATLTRSADRVIANAEAIRDQLLRQEHLPAHKVVLIRNGLDLARFDERRVQPPEAPLPQTGDAPVAVLVANLLNEVKRQENFLAALVLARRIFPRLTGFLVGGGPRQEALEALAGRLGLRGAVHFLGFRTDVPAILQRATLGVLCSRREGLSNAVMEGMAAGLPMVVTDTGGNPELVRHGERGLVVPVDEPVELADGMVKLLSDPQLARRMGQAGRRFVERELSLEKMVQAHDALFRSMGARD